jgi:hypothetical protein
MKGEKWCEISENFETSKAAGGWSGALVLKDYVRWRGGVFLDGFAGASEVSRRDCC